MAGKKWNPKYYEKINYKSFEKNIMLFPQKVNCQESNTHLIRLFNSMRKYAKLEMGKINQ